MITTKHDTTTNAEIQKIGFNALKESKRRNRTFKRRNPQNVRFLTLF